MFSAPRGGMLCRNYLRGFYCKELIPETFFWIIHNARFHCEIIHNAAAPGQVLAQRQQEASTQSVHQVSEVLRGELSAFKDTQNVQVRVLR